MPVVENLQARADMPLPLIDRIIYGPVDSRRLGRSLGVNLLPGDVKACTMNCAYCEYGWTRGGANRGQSARWPAAGAVETALEVRLAFAAATGEAIDRITIAGHGEPTLHPDFDAVVRRIASVRDRHAPSIPLAILSNSTTAASPRVRSGLARFDERFMKLDAGDPFTFAELNGCTMSLGETIDALRELPSLVIQAMFVADASGEKDNASDAAVDRWLTAVESVGATRVHIYTINRAPTLTRLRPVADRRLREIAGRVRRAGIPANVFCAAAQPATRAGSRTSSTATDGAGS